MFDIIGDIHGYASHAEALLIKLGYRKSHGAYRHPQRQVLFLGDLVDRGPEQVETIDLVRRMVDAGSAVVVMGNHELNAIAYVTPDPKRDGHFVRANTKRNRSQHISFLEQVGEGSSLHRELIDWFKTIPVFFDAQFNAIHACWNNDAIAQLKPLLNSDNSFKEQAWALVSTKGSEYYQSCELLLKGPEIDLPKGITYNDKDGISRGRCRLRWWDIDAKTYSTAALVPRATQGLLPHDLVDPSLLFTYDQKTPLFVGHYWMTGSPQKLSNHVACLDYSIGKGTNGGKLCAYRWDGESTIDDNKFVWIEAGVEPSINNPLVYTQNIEP